MDEGPLVKVCQGPPRCDGRLDPENCEWCLTIDPFDENWQAKLAVAQKGN